MDTDKRQAQGGVNLRGENFMAAGGSSRSATMSKEGDPAVPWRGYDAEREDRFSSEVL